MSEVINEWEVFGLEAPTEEPTQEPSEGGQEPAVAEPAIEGGQDPEIAEPEDDEDMEPQPAEKKPLTKEERRENARRRREQEMTDAVNAALEEERRKTNERLSAFFGEAKMKNQYAGGAEITTLEQAEKWAEDNKLAGVQRDLKAGKLTMEALQKVVDESPTVKKLQQENEQARQQLQAQAGQQFQKTVEMELAQIRKINPAIESLTDILQMDTGKEFARLVQTHGLGYLEAYRFANMDSMMAQASAVAATGARNMGGGKGHMTATRPRGDGAVEVPADVKENFRLLMPGITDEEIQREYMIGHKK